MIAFKTLSAVGQYHDLHPQMAALLSWVYRVAWPRGATMTITRIADHDAGQKTKVHTDGPPHRAVDLRIMNVTLDQARAVEAAVNAMWTFDPSQPGRNCALLHDAGSGNHLHLQVARGDATRPNPAGVPPMATA